MASHVYTSGYSSGLLLPMGALPKDVDERRKNGVIEKNPGGRENLSFQELAEIEKERRQILLRSDLPFWRILLYFNGTSLKEIVTDSLVLTTLLIYVWIRVRAHTIDYVPAAVAMLEKTNINILGGFLSFFLVLFVNQTNDRFLEMYGFSKACSGRIQDIAGVARTQLPPEVGQKLVRHFNAAHVAGYVGLNAIGMGSPYSKTFFFDHYNADNKLVTPLLTPEELKVLSHHDMDHSGLCMKELVTWCQQDVSNARKDGHIDTNQEKLLHSKILDFRAAMDGMYDYTDQPPHFFYIHFLVLLSALYLPLFAIDTAYAGGWGAEKAIGLDILQGIIVFLQCIFVVGLRSLGTKMIDPYGDDLEDLSVINYVEGTLEICATIMGAKQPANKEVSGVTTGLL
mmetsp:Transcript_9954/g.14249  ORF Transcript_9954/g.14249 Transcript_9954/m.14249 type:complete len:398 (-) Transcript_9954:146-1339(-)